jgi:hypothetical protein
MPADPTIAKSYYEREIGDPESRYVSPEDAQLAIDQIYLDLNNEIASVIESIDLGEGTDEVAIQAAGPTDAAIEIWIDTDENYTSNASFTRGSTAVTTSSLTSGSTYTANLALAPAYRLYKITTTAPCRFRMYTATAKRTADASRPITTPPTGDHGLAFEFVSTASLLGSEIIPAVDGYDAKTTPDGQIPIAITNTGVGTATITVTLVWVRTE